MSPDERDWTMAQVGYFVLLSNILASSANLLDQYTLPGRTSRP